MPMTRGRIAVHFDQGIGDIVDDEFDGPKALEERLDLGTALRISGIRRAVPYAVVDEHIGNRIGIRMRRSPPAAVVIVHIARLELDQLFAIFERFEPLFNGLGHAVAPYMCCADSDAYLRQF